MNPWLAVRTAHRPRARIAYRRNGDGPAILLIHATLSASAQLGPLADRLAGTFTVLAVDRRGSGETRLGRSEPVGPIDIALHTDDLAAVLAAEHISRTVVAGHSYGGCLALELAARRPDLVAAVWAYEPPYAPLGSASVQADLAAVAARTLEAARMHGTSEAAEAFLEAVAGGGTLERLSPTARALVRDAGHAAIADAPLEGLDRDGLRQIACPVKLAVGGASRPMYAEIASALAGWIPGADLERLPGLGHTAPITEPDAIARSIGQFAGDIGHSNPRS